jgi:hypothetical protein
MTKAQFLSRLSALTKDYPLYSQESASDPIFAARLFDIA